MFFMDTLLKGSNASQRTAYCFELIYGNYSISPSSGALHCDLGGGKIKTKVLYDDFF